MALTEEELELPAREIWENRQRQRYLDRANLPRRAVSRTLSDYSPTVKAKCEYFLEEAARGKAYEGLLIYGDPGRGKTSLALTVLRETLLRSPHDWLGVGKRACPLRPGYFMEYADLLRTHKRSWENDERGTECLDLVDSLYCSLDPGQNCRVLVLDDVGKEHAGATGFNKSVLHDLFRSRWNRDAPTIVTTNLGLDDWEDAYGDAMASFIYEAFTHVEVKGPDRRRAHD